MQKPRFAPALAVVGLAAVAAPAAAQETLTVYTYGSMTTEWGPGPALTQAFEADCECTIDWVAVDDGVALLSRLKLEGEGTQADVVLGLDTNLTVEAEATGLLAPHGIDLSGLDLPIDWTDPLFVPFDWGYFAFVYDTEAIEAPPASFRELVDESDAEILIQDPRTSTPGLGLLLWVKSIYGEEAPRIWEALRPRIVTVTSGWSEAYGLFLEGEAPMVLSYTTSPAYHEIAEEIDRYQAAIFEEGHYMQIEVAAATEGTDVPDLARSFLAFLVSDEAQAILPTTNWMYPVTMPADGLPDAFAQPIPAEDARLFEPETAAAERGAWIDEWLDAMSR